MPATTVVFFREAEGAVPVLDWLASLRRTQPRAFAKCLVRIERLAQLGHELRRPEADLLRDGIYELRARMGSVNYRILYFFHGRSACVLAHSLTKESAVPAAEIDVAVRRKAVYTRNPGAHTHREGV
ncbi:MAG: type II toxin-antitoxin system RelE/ParE family toxin [Phycisphaeraceae bacterium]|nr:type II toxin-antitoxin system RelE/ParE family toxin [Phycisphaeraceae bacterium]